MSTRALFLIAAAAAIFHLSSWQASVVLFGYGICAYFDQWLSRREREKVISDEMDGWEKDSDEAEYETKGNWSRVRLTGQNQIIAARVANLLRRITV